MIEIYQLFPTYINSRKDNTPQELLVLAVFLSRNDTILKFIPNYAFAKKNYVSKGT